MRKNQTRKKQNQTRDQKSCIINHNAMHRASIEPVVKNVAIFISEQGPVGWWQHCAAKLQNCKTSNCKSAALSRPQVSSFRFSFSDNFARWSGGWNRDMKPLFISCSILASSTTSPYRCLTRKLLALQLFQTKMPSNYLMYKGWYHLCVNASNCKKNVPKLDCEWKARRFVVHQTFRSCTL